MFFIWESKQAVFTRKLIYDLYMCISQVSYQTTLMFYKQFAK